MAGILDLDIGAITDPNDPAPEGTYKLAITKAEKAVNDETGSAGVNFQYRILTPGEHQGKTVFHYVNVIKKDGTENKMGAWQVKEFMTRKGVKKGKLFESLPALVGLEFDAELSVEESENEQYGPRNSIKRLLK